jgi:hypothetical protein
VIDVGGAAFEKGSCSWRVGKEQPSQRAQGVGDWERAAFVEGSCISNVGKSSL